MWRSLVAFVALWCSTAVAQNVQISQILVRSRPYTLVIDAQKHMAVQMFCRVTGGGTEAMFDTRRNWFTPEELQPFVLEDEDYIGSGYHRGHLCALDWFDGTGWWSDTNCTAAIVPMLPGCNIGPIREVEKRVIELAKDRGQVDVTVTCLFEREMPMMVNADEDHIVPSGFRYVIEYAPTAIEAGQMPDPPGPGQRLDNGSYGEVYVVQNEEPPDDDAAAAGPVAPPPAEEPIEDE